MLKRCITMLILTTLCLSVSFAQGESSAVISAGNNTSFVIQKDGSLWGAGRNEFGQLGLGHKENVTVLTKIMDDVASVSAAHYHTIVLKRDGTLWAFGTATGGPFEDNTFVPVQVLDNVKQASAGTFYTAAVKMDGSLWIYGNMSLGDGSANPNPNSFQKSLTEVKTVFAGDDNCLVIKTDDSLWIWGDNNTGQIGNGSMGEAVTLATKVMDSVATVSAGTGIMAVQKDGSLWMWGATKIPALTGLIKETSTVPVKVMDNVLSCSVGSETPTYFVLKRDGSVWGFGSGHVIRVLLGDTAVELPKKVTDQVVALSNESRHLLIVKKDQTLWTGGQSIDGRLGFGNAEKYDSHPLTQIMTHVLDVPAPWALAEVREAEYRKLVPPAMQSDYDKTVNRSEFCALAIVCIEEINKMPIEAYLASRNISLPAQSPFVDIQTLPADVKNDILSAYALNIVAGTSATTFDPIKPITREQAAKMLTATAAALGKTTNSPVPAFSDGDRIANWAKPFIGYVVDVKVMGGVGNNRFDPQGGYQRQQAYMTMLRLFKLFN